MSEKRPGMLKRARNLAKAAFAAVKHLKEEGHVLVDKTEHEARLDICKTCPEYSKYVEDECGECGCPLATRKAWLASSCCPNNWWPGDHDKIEICEEENTQNEAE